MSAIGSVSDGSLLAHTLIGEGVTKWVEIRQKFKLGEQRSLSAAGVRRKKGAGCPKPRSLLPGPQEERLSVAYQDDWKPARAPTSPESNATPTPPFTTVVSLMRKPNDADPATFSL